MDKGETILKSSEEITNLYYINLDWRTDRKSHVENQLKLLNWNGRRFPAIHHPNGCLGCALSHLALLKHARNNNLSHILILEDDVTFLDPSLFLNNLNIVLQNHKDFDVLLLAGNNMGHYERIDERCVKVSHCKTTTAYLVKRNYYDILIRNYESGIHLLQKYPNKKNFYSIDEYWCLLQLEHKWLLLTPLTIIQNPDVSDIEKCHVDYTGYMLDLDKEEFIRRQNQLLSDKKRFNY